jgi:uncharacterized protein (TIRG00374 family)
MSIVNFKDNNRKKNFLKLIFTLILFLIIFKKIDLSETYHLFRLSLEVFLYLTFITLVLFILSSLRPIFLYIGNKKFNLYFWFKIYGLASIFNLIIPGKLGDFSKYYLIKKNYDKYPKSYLLGMFLLERSLDLLIIAIFYLSLYGINKSNNLFYLLSLILFILFNLFLHFKQPKRIKKFKFYLFKKLQVKILKFIHHFNIYKIKLLKSFNFFNAIIFTIIFWVLSLYQINVLLDVFNNNLYFIESCLLIITIILVSLLPITFSGLGTRELLFIYFFGPIIGANEAFVVSIYFYIFRYLFPAILGLPFLIKKTN